MPSSGVVKTERLTPKSFLKTYTFPVGVTEVLLKNDGLIPVKIWFNDGDESSAFQLASDRELPVFSIQGGVTVLNYKSDIDGSISLFMWG